MERRVLEWDERWERGTERMEEVDQNEELAVTVII